MHKQDGTCQASIFYYVLDMNFPGTRACDCWEGVDNALPLKALQNAHW